MTALVLSLFPGIGLLDMAFEEEGFCVVRGPDLLWGGDIHRFRPPAGRFDGVIGGPPCQAFSRLRFLVQHNGFKVAANLIPEFERVVAEARPRWALMENVPDAPPPDCARMDMPWAEEHLLNNRWVGGEQNRVRRFTFASRDFTGIDIRQEALEPFEWKPAALASGGGREVPVAVGGSGKRKATKARDLGFKTASYAAAAAAAQGLPVGFLEDAPFTVAGKIKAIGNGVPLPMGRAVARAVREALGIKNELESAAP